MKTRTAQQTEVAGYGPIPFGVVDNREPARLPWFQDANKIPAEILAAAEKVAREKSADDHEYKWRMDNWSAVMTGWSYAVRMYRPWFMYSPEQALEWMSGLCLHAWSNKRDHVQHENYILGTYDKGYNQTCSKCGEEQYVRTSFNNYSGD